MKYDLIVIGGGIGGYTAAIYAAKENMSVALIESGKVGGTCLHRGCIPMKSLLHSSNIFFEAKNQKGINFKELSFDENEFYAKKDETVEALASGLKKGLPSNVTLYNEVAKLKSNTVVCVGDAELSAKHILIATGSRPKVLNIKGFENTIDTDAFFSSPMGAKNIVVIGGGVAGVEIAFYHSNLGHGVTIVEALGSILPSMPEEIQKKLAVVLKRKGIKILTDARVSQIEKDKLWINSGESIEADCIISAVGRVANLDIGLEHAGVQCSDFIHVDSNMATNVPNIYACGDVVGKSMLAHYASASAQVAVDSMLNRAHSKDLQVVPQCVYTEPQAASVGEKTDNFAVALVGGCGMSRVLGYSFGYVKIYQDENSLVVGAELLCPNATELVGELALMISQKIRVEKAKRLIRAHPTVNECIGDAFDKFV